MRTPSWVKDASTRRQDREGGAERGALAPRALTHFLPLVPADGGDVPSRRHRPGPDVHAGVQPRRDDDVRAQGEAHPLRRDRRVVLSRTAACARRTPRAATCAIDPSSPDVPPRRRACSSPRASCPTRARRSTRRRRCTARTRRCPSRARGSSSTWASKSTGAVNNIGLEQELFFIPREAYERRMDLQFTGQDGSGQDAGARPGRLRPLHGAHQRRTARPWRA